MTLTLTAVGAVVGAVLELSLWPFLQIGGAHPHLVLVYVVVVAMVLGLDAGLTGAFVGGLALDLLAPRPLGSSAFALLLCAGLAVLLGRSVVRLRYITPILAVFLLSFVYSLIVIFLYNALSGPVTLQDPLAILLPGAIYDAIIAAAVAPLAIAIRTRRLEQERVDW